MADRSFLDWPFFEPRHRAFAEALDAWCADHIAPLEADGEPHGDAGLDARCREIVRRLADGGWLNNAVPQAGGALDVRTLCLTRETLARHLALADFSFAMQGLGSGPISLFGTDAQRDAYLPAVAAGRKIAAFALSEPDAGSDVAAISTTARRDGDHWVLDGAKTWISNGGIADFYVVFARTNDGGAKGLGAFIVDADSPGLRIAERIPLIAPHPLATLVFEGCRIPSDRMIGGEGEGFRIAMATLDVFRSTVGAAALGLARRAFDESLDYARKRQLFGAPLTELQLTQAALADMALTIDASALLVYRAAWTKDTGAARVTREAAMAKLHATDGAQEVIDKAVQMHGGHGVRVGSTVERLYREVRALRIYEGASEVQKVVIARQALAAAGG
ncbi:MAG TPA: acyl-CoA dehydrogenase family protein [Caulobacteraceae bacterium]|jgi:acyl-CoA dehydrogenase|nr:acyl-CoA dehydrogenase family protein [Caulobacteraceae bacterium]